MDLWPSRSLIDAMDVLFVFSIYFSVGLYSWIQIFLTNNWYKAGLVFNGEFSESLNFVVKGTLCVIHNLLEM